MIKTVPGFPQVNFGRIESDLNQEFKALESGYNARKAKRLDNWRKYQFQPYGNESEGSSKIVDSTIFNMVEWATPSLIQPFMETPDFIKLVPESGELQDIISSEYNRELLNYQMRKRMDMYSVYYDTFKTFQVTGDAYWKITWQPRDLIKGEPVGRNHLSFINPNAIRWDWTVQGGFMHSRVVTHEEDWTRSDILGMKGKDGAIDSQIDAVLEGMGRSWKHTRLRDEATESKGYAGEKLDITEEAKKLFLRREHWTEYDMDGSGKLVPVMAIFIEDHLVSISENPYDFKRPPFTMAECIRDPMGNPALGWADVLDPIQQFRTAILRMASDNLNNQLNGMYEVDQTNVDDIGFQLLMNAKGGSKIGIPVRQKGSITPLPSAPMARDVYQVWELLEIAGENRGGFTRYSQGLDSKALNQTATGFVGITQRSEMRLWEMATRFAESCLKPMVRMMISLNQQKLTKQDIEVQFGIDAKGIAVTKPDGTQETLDADPGDLIGVTKEDIGGHFSVVLDLQVGSDKQQKVNNMFQYGQYLGSLQTVDPEILNAVNQVILVETARLMEMPKVENVVRRQNAGRGISIPNSNAGAGEAQGGGGGVQGTQTESVLSEALPQGLPGQPIQ
jgi:hypothetical protein